MPACKMQGCCCRAASPSIPFHQLMAKAANGDEFARNFFSIFIPHASHADAAAIVPGLVERTLKASQKDEAFQTPDDIVFYQCRYIGEDNKCRIWEDRPELCRAYPDSPFMVFAPGCAFEPWAIEVKEKFNAIKAELAKLQDLKEELASMKEGKKYTKIDAKTWFGDNLETLSLVMLLTPSFLVSPVGSYLD